ncbi:VOC family protein [Halobacillus litoralis]|uniref:VOC family protein n=1 Tax=Halobacillus litoralis TaxID=45668 RepID=UPI001CD3AD9C|nr:VOC family protein [Halobacillus litoralis]MCA0970569.1 VOC family protein [Halobacillus litoralis]
MEEKFFQKPATYVDVVGLQVTDLKRSLRFYHERLGLQVLEQMENRAVLSADGVRPLLELEEPQSVESKDSRAVGLYHFAILVPERGDVGRLIQHLSKEGIPIGGADHLVSEAIYFNDPDQNGIEVYADRSASEWQWAGHELKMTTDPLDVDGLVQAAGRNWDGFPSATRMGHIHLTVQDLNETLRFYTEGLGFKVTNHMFPQAAFLSTEGYHHHLALNTWKGEGAPMPSSKSAGLKEFTVVFPSDEEKHRAVKSLEEMGLSLQEGIVIDPSGNSVRLV